MHGMRDSSTAETRTLLTQHTEATGQPWLVNALAYRDCEANGTAGGPSRSRRSMSSGSN